MLSDEPPSIEDGLEAENPLLKATIDSDSPIDIPLLSDKDPKLIPHEYKPTYRPNQKLNQTGTREIPVLYPTPKEMQDFPAYIELIEKKAIHLESGIAKIIPPAGWLSDSKPHFKYNDLRDMPIKRVLSSTIVRVAPDLDGIYFQKSRHKTYNKDGTNVGGFMQKATSIAPSKRLKTLDEVVNHFWSNIDNSNQRSSLYGADVEGTLFGDEIQEFNMNHLGSLVDLAEDSGMQIPGVTTPYLYFGSYRTAFAWHTEDMDLYSLNYQHFGEPKIWYAIPSVAAGRFERLCAQLYQLFGTTCHSFLRHKICLTRPDILEKHKIPYGCIAQYPGEFIVTFPRGYHMGFNVGFNCNEAINFGISRWFGYALQAKICDCQPEMAVRMNLNEVLGKYAENDEYKEFFMREPTKSTERKTTSVAISEYCRDAKPTVKRLLLFDSSFEEEVEYNEEQAQISPFCCVCQYFSPKTNCQLKGPIGAKSKSPCYISPIMLSKMQQDSIGAYRLNRNSGIPFLPFPDSPLRQCGMYIGNVFAVQSSPANTYAQKYVLVESKFVDFFRPNQNLNFVHVTGKSKTLPILANCKIAVHANCYSFIEGFPKEKSRFFSKNKPPQIVKLGETQPVKLDVPLKPIRIKVPKRCLADANLEKEQSLSPVTTTAQPRRIVLKKNSPKSSKPPTNFPPPTKPSNNIFNKIMKRVKFETSTENQGNIPVSSSSDSAKIKQEPVELSVNDVSTNAPTLLQAKQPVTVINPIVSRFEVFGDEKPGSSTSKSICENSRSESKWLCDPCRLMTEDTKCREFICCEFCNMRGGALIQRRLPGLSEIGYVHVVCSIMSRLTSIQRNDKDELVAHSLPPPREYSALKKTLKNTLPTTNSKARLCATYINYNKSLFSGNFNDNFCGLCREPLHEVLVKCEKCHSEGRRMDVYHPTCAHLLNFQFCARVYPEVAVAICPVHFDLSNEPETDLKVGDTVVHRMNEEFQPLAEVVFIGKITNEIILSFQGGYIECDKNQILACDCKSLGCNGAHFPGYLIAIRNRGAIGVTLGVYRGRKLEQNYRVKHDDGLGISCGRSELYSLKDPNCPSEYRRLLNKRRAEKDLLERMNVPIKRERRMTAGQSTEDQLSPKKNPPLTNCTQATSPTTFISLNIKQEVIEEVGVLDSMAPH